MVWHKESNHWLPILMFYKQRIKHCVVNRPHLYKLCSCPNHSTSHNLYSPHNLCLIIPHHNPQDPNHSQLHHNFLHHKSLYHKHPLPDLHLKIRRLRHPFLSQTNVRIWKCSFTRAFFTSTDDPRNSEQNRTRSHGSCHICKQVWPEHGKNMLWPKYLKRLFGTTWRMSFYRKSNDGSATRTNMQQCL